MSSRSRIASIPVLLVVGIGFGCGRVSNSDLPGSRSTFKLEDPADTIPIVSVSASGGHPGCVPNDALDGNLGTSWCSLGVGQFITADLGALKEVSGAAVAWRRGDLRVNHYVVSTSQDGNTFEVATSGDSSGTSVDFERYDFSERTARYVRLTDNGNTENNWANVTELRVLGGISNPIVSLSPTSLSFGDQAVGTSSSVQFVTVTNTGTANMIFSTGFTMTGDYTFAGLGTCALAVSYPPGSGCKVSVVFTPTAIGTRTGTLNISSNGLPALSTVPLSGTGQPSSGTSCSDGIKNGTETDVDCGGSCSTKCADGKHCSVGPDCTSNSCASGTCAVNTAKLLYRVTYENGSTAADVGTSHVNLDVPGNPSPGGSVTVVSNPKKDATNGSAMVGKHSLPAIYSRAELVSQRSPTLENTFTYKISYYLPQSFLSTSFGFALISQWSTWPCGPPTAGSQICGFGSDDGVFDELGVCTPGSGQCSGSDRGTFQEGYQFRHRAAPNCFISKPGYAPDKWTNFKMQVKWTKSDTGFMKVWKDGQLLVDKQGIKTMFDSFEAGKCDLFWTAGLYAGPQSPATVYTDNIEIWEGLVD